ncbi:MAG TPA: tRNA (N6-threonylcarbamoyladenosine(37)-N6)-methyltransferase TrmO [Polyangiaceae bacterium]|nr:tRNA (N6-threonylcarbamoyladenosine(37)-N6)-methyltransferase TrmO [Polyangiaceae bacterium]
MPSEPEPPTLLTLSPIGVARTPFRERSEAPRQPQAAAGVRGSIELRPGHGFEHALLDLERFSRIWVLFWFHLNEGWRPKVLPPRSQRRRGVFATRSPHRPNPLGLSVLRLERVEGLTLHVLDVDLVDGTPVLDIKPYVAYTDAHPDATAGWLESPGPGSAPDDPAPSFEIAWAEPAEAQAAWLLEAHGVDLRGPAARVLSLGPQPHPYRRIRAEGEGMRLAIKDWRLFFTVEGRRITVRSIATGYRERELWGEGGGAPDAHRAFVERFGRR